ncbi:MAG: hypothetical protein H7123_02275 [Thermoleophilia bacterium]|nr:hypothetical protein [Thermoleophilia bacterium]
MPESIAVTMYCDPGCPWGYSATPALTTLMWRYGAQLKWRLVTIGLTDDAAQYIARGYTPTNSTQGYARFRRYGMPIASDPRPRVVATAPACRAIIATRIDAPELEYEVFRALQLGWFTTPLVMDEPAAIATALESVHGLNVDHVIARLYDDDVNEHYELDRAEARTAADSPTEAQGKSANSDGKGRYTAPSLVFSLDSQHLEAGGFQPLAAYDVLLANLAPQLHRRAPAEQVLDVLAAFPAGLATAEIASIMTHGNDLPDLLKTELELIAVTAEGLAQRVAKGHDALWVAT